MSTVKEKIWKAIMLPIIGYYIVKNVVAFVKICKQPWTEKTKHNKLIDKPQGWY
jgi:hypothetical protein